jgi:hypothetical protein
MGSCSGAISTFAKKPAHFKRPCQQEHGNKRSLEKTTRLCYTVSVTEGAFLVSIKELKLPCGTLANFEEAIQ